MTVQISGQRFELDPRGIERVTARELPEPVREHYVVIAGRRFPPKQVIALATGLDRADFTTHQARRILRRLGFSAARESAASGSTRGASARPAGSAFAEALRPHIGEWVAIADGTVVVAAPTPSAVLGWLARHDIRADSLFQVPESEDGAGGGAPA
jgi:hypothetical protein